MKTFYMAILLFLLFSSSKINSQCIEYTSANTSKTLCNNNVNVVALDAQGVKWFGTELGLSKFDNVSWKSFTTNDGLVNNSISDIVVDALNNKWIATDSGVSKYDGNVFTNFTEKNGLLNNYVYHIAVDKKNTIWFATNGGVCAFDGKTWKSFTQENGLAEKAITSITVDEKGFIWCTHSKGVSVYNGTKWTNFNSDNSKIRNYATSVYVDIKGNKWITTGNGLVKFDGLQWTLQDVDNDFTDKFNRALGADLKGNLWFSGWMKLYKFDGVNWKEYTESEGLPCNNIYSMAVEKNGVLWFASLEGALKFDGLKWTRYTTSGGLANNSVKSMMFDKQGNNWIATLGGLSVFNGSNWAQYSIVNGKTFEVYSLDADSKNNKWLATSIGLLKFDGKTISRVGDETMYKYVKVDKQDNIWVCAETYDEYDYEATNLHKFDGKEWTYNKIGGDELYMGSSNASTFDIDTTGNMWFGTLYDGIVMFNGFNWVQYSSEINYRTINTIKVDKNNTVWICTSNGIVSYDNQSKWTNYDMSSDDTEQNYVYSMFIDSKGNKWFETTKHGILKFDGTNWYSVVMPPCIADKLIESIAVDDKGNLWIGADGLNKISSIKLNNYLPEISDIVPVESTSSTESSTESSDDYNDDYSTPKTELKDFGYSKFQYILNEANTLCTTYDPYVRRFSFDDATNTLKWIDKDGEIECTANINDIKIYNDNTGSSCYIDFECKDGSTCISINTQGPTKVTAISTNSCTGADQIVNTLNKITNNNSGSSSSLPSPSPQPKSSSTSSSKYSANLNTINNLCEQYDEYVRHFTFDDAKNELTWVDKSGDIICKAKVGDITVHVMDSKPSYYVRFECITTGSKCVDCTYGGATDVSAITLNNKSGAKQIVDELVKMGFQRKADE